MKTMSSLWATPSGRDAVDHEAEIIADHSRRCDTVYSVIVIASDMLFPTRSSAARNPRLLMVSAVYTSLAFMASLRKRVVVPEAVREGMQR
jgi:hypothetical protein